MSWENIAEGEKGERGATSSMGIHFGRFAKLVAVIFVSGVASIASVAQGQSSASETAEVGARLTDGAPVSLTSDEIVARMLERNRLRNEQLRRYSAGRNYVIRNPEGKFAAHAVVPRGYHAPDN